jgi:REP element-mobilizing transposase RayT
VSTNSQEHEQATEFPYHRRSLRLPTHDYTWTRGYFVTIRVRGHEPLFDIPALKAILAETWEELPERFPGITLDEFVIMPDHVHFIIWLNGLAEYAPTLGRVVGAYKSLSAVAWVHHLREKGMKGDGHFWLRNYFERVIRNQEELERIRLYIRDNPKKLETRQY